MPGGAIVAMCALLKDDQLSSFVTLDFVRVRPQPRFISRAVRTLFGKDCGLKDETNDQITASLTLIWQ